MSIKKLDGQVAVVTGASRGVGAETARVLAEAGCRLVLTARDEEWLEATARDLRARGARPLVVPADITDLEMVEEVVESALGQFDRVDIVVNAAGMVWPLELAAEVDAEEWAYSIHTNLVGPFYLASNVLPIMLDQAYGRIVNLTCQADAPIGRGVSALRAAKAGLEMWTRVVAAEVAGTGVRIVCLDPGVVDTATRREVLEMDDEDTAVDVSMWLPDASAPVLSSADEVARMIYWLVSTEDQAHSSQVFSGADGAWRERVRHDLKLTG